jgi:hypothetical protein
LRLLLCEDDASLDARLRPVETALLADYDLVLRVPDDGDLAAGAADVEGRVAEFERRRETLDQKDAVQGRAVHGRLL